MEIKMWFGLVCLFWVFALMLGCGSVVRYKNKVVDARYAYSNFKACMELGFAGAPVMLLLFAAWHVFNAAFSITNDELNFWTLCVVFQILTAVSVFVGSVTYVAFILGKALQTLQLKHEIKVYPYRVPEVVEDEQATYGAEATNACEAAHIHSEPKTHRGEDCPAVIVRKSELRSKMEAAESFLAEDHQGDGVRACYFTLEARIIDREAKNTTTCGLWKLIDFLLAQAKDVNLPKVG